MQITMGIVGMPNVTVTAFSSYSEDLEHAEQAKEEEARFEEEMDAFEAGDGPKPKRRARGHERFAFNAARKRFAQQGAKRVRYFLGEWA